MRTRRRGHSVGQSDELENDSSSSPSSASPTPRNSGFVYRAPRSTERQEEEEGQGRHR